MCSLQMGAGVSECVAVCPSIWFSTHHVLYRLGSHERVVRLRAIHLIADCPKQAVAIPFTLLHTKAKLGKALAVLSLPVQRQGRGWDHSAQYSTAQHSMHTCRHNKRGEERVGIVLVCTQWSVSRFTTRSRFLLAQASEAFGLGSKV